MNILIVDDSKLNVMVARTILEQNMQETLHIAYSGKEALNLIEVQPIDLVLLDIHMPEMEGTEVLQIIKASPVYNHIAVIMLTSVDLEDQIEECFQMGAIDYIIKPIKERDYLARVKSALREIQLKNELKESNRKLLASQAQLIQQQKMVGIGQLAAGIAHEINNPLGFIVSNMAVLENYQNEIGMNFEKLRNGEAIDFEDLNYVLDDSRVIFEETREGLHRITKIVKELRYFAAIDVSKGFEPYKINDSIESILTIIKTRLKGNVVIIKELNPVSEILALNEELNQVIMNMLFNSVYAIESKESKQGFVELKTWEDPENIYFSVTDDGVGIPIEHLDKIFNPFFTTKEVGDGIGLGLSSAYTTIVNRHGGEITVKSDLGKGANFTVRLPKKNTRSY